MNGLRIEMTGGVSAIVISTFLFRHCYFNFQYFMVYVNAPLGLVACLGRLIQAVFLGLWTLSRLDMSTMSSVVFRLVGKLVGKIGK